jgi:phosphoribosyl 1,2-cyclic phosphate phosphodiesterase
LNELEIVFLGSGTSHGIPMIGCRCAVCTSDDPRDRRNRASVAVRLPKGGATRGRVILIDAGPELRLSAVAMGLERVDAVLFTHAHADHIMGLDDIRRYNDISRGMIPCYGDAETLATLGRVFGYAVRSTDIPNRPSISLEEFAPAAPEGGCPGDGCHAHTRSSAGGHEAGDHALPQGTGFAEATPDRRVRAWHPASLLAPREVCGVRVQPVPLVHDKAQVLGFRIGEFAYCTDCSAIPEASQALLQGLDLLVLDALRYTPHPGHFNIEQALAMVGRLRPRRTLFTHIAHEVSHARASAELPPGVELAYDGLRVKVPLTG